MGSVVSVCDTCGSCNKLASMIEGQKNSIESLKATCDKQELLISRLKNVCTELQNRVKMDKQTMKL